jgi:hypothetical protein
VDPAVAFRSGWPVDRIWLANQPGADPEATVDVSGAVRLEVRRRDDAVALRRLDAAPFGFRSALGRGAMLEAAVISPSPRTGIRSCRALRALLDEGSSWASRSADLKGGRGPPG